jgi:fluoride exporter
LIRPLIGSAIAGKSGSTTLPLFSWAVASYRGLPIAPPWGKADETAASGFEMNYLLVFIGGGLGSCLRHAVNVICPRFLGANFPYHTFIINITGSTIMGLIAGYLAFKGDAAQSWRLFIMTGILGGYTTFSAFSLDAGLLYERGEIGLAALYVLGSVILSILGLFAGLAIIRSLV